MNVQLLQEVKEEIRRNPHNFDMTDSISVDEDLEETGSPLFCGTSACIAGFAYILAMSTLPVPVGSLSSFTKVDRADIGTFAVLKRATELLELSEAQADELFFYDGWEQPYSDRYLRANTAKEQAEVATEYIDRFIAKHTA